jgi:hypothetical protein
MSRTNGWKIVNINFTSTILALKERIELSFIEPILKKTNSDDFKYLAVIESGLVNVFQMQVLEEFGNLCLKQLRKEGWK